MEAAAHGEPKGEVTLLLEACRAGSADAHRALFDRVYGELKAIATRRLANLRRPSIDPTELVHEASLRLLGESMGAQNRQHFFGIAAAAIRYTLIDIVRRQQAEKRGGGMLAVTFDAALSQTLPAPTPAEQWSEVEQALRVFEQAYPRQCRALELAFLVGMKQHEIAEATGVTLRTVERDLRFAKAWLRGRLSA
ncbi:ECF-type sigma factor [Luteimonas aquatica]|uniref:ECF-type sigma factor n=1 Tax=Luteimonas aquatica TaxID=450364 RepID=UPI001F56B39D|nr:ECF-type sigma factor [Luteimonas aquatica]